MTGEILHFVQEDLTDMDAYSASTGSCPIVGPLFSQTEVEDEVRNKHKRHDPHSGLTLLLQIPQSECHGLSIRSSAARASAVRSRSCIARSAATPQPPRSERQSRRRQCPSA